MKTILIIYLILSVISFAFSVLVSVYIALKFKRENPDVTIKKMPTFDKIVSWVRAILIAFIPIVHFLVIVVWLLAWDICVENIEDSIWEKMVE